MLKKYSKFVFLLTLWMMVCCPLIVKTKESVVNKLSDIIYGGREESDYVYQEIINSNHLYTDMDTVAIHCEVVDENELLGTLRDLPIEFTSKLYVEAEYMLEEVEHIVEKGRRLSIALEDVEVQMRGEY